MGNNNVIGTMYHYTTKKKLDISLSEGLIKPRTPLLPESERLYCIEMGVEIPPDGKLYRFGFLNTPNPPEWTGHKYLFYLWDCFLDFIYRKGREGNIHILPIPLMEDDEVFVVDYADVEWDLLWGGVKPESWKKLVESKTPLKQYQGGFELPHIILANEKEIGVLEKKIVELPPPPKFV